MIKSDKFEITEVNLKDLVPYENNPRVNDGAVQYVKASIVAFNFQRPIAVDEDMVLLAGHTRLKAVQELREAKVWEQFAPEKRKRFAWLEKGVVPTVVVRGLTEAQKRAYRIADNRASELTLFDFDKVTAELQDLGSADIDMTAFGFEPIKEQTVDADQATVEEALEDEAVICPRCGKVVA